MGMLQDFKAFIRRGNVIDLAVGVIIGGAFGKIVTSLVNDILTPFISIIAGGVNLSSLRTRIGGSDASPVFLNWGSFIQAMIDFLIIAVSIFFIVRVINRFHKPAEAEPPALTKDQQLLTEIRDQLARR